MLEKLQPLEILNQSLPMPTITERILYRLGITSRLRRIELIRDHLSLPKSCYFGSDFHEDQVKAKKINLSFEEDSTRFSAPNCLNWELFPQVVLPVKPRKSEPFAISVVNAFVWGRLGGVITSDGIFLDEVSHAFGLKGLKHPVWKKILFPKPVKLEGISLSLAGPASTNYFHWLAQLLPKLGLILDSTEITRDEINYIIISGPTKSFHRESLAAIGFKDDQIIVLEENSYFHCDNLICTSFLTAGSASWAIDWLRRNLIDTPSFASCRIYVSRADASTRRIVNEVSLIKLLAAYQFETVHLEGLSIAQQAAIFSGAKAIIAPHGAGLTNIIFSNAGAKVFEIFSETWVRGTYYMLSHQCNHNYTCCIGASQNRQVSSDYIVDLDVVEQWLKTL